MENQKLLVALIVQPYGLPTLERRQKPGEILISGPNGHYFMTQFKKPGRRAFYLYEYFGIRGLKSGEAHLTKKDTIAMLKEKLERVIAE